MKIIMNLSARGKKGVEVKDFANYETNDKVLQCSSALSREERLFSVRGNGSPESVTNRKESG